MFGAADSYRRIENALCKNHILQVNFIQDDMIYIDTRGRFNRDEFKKLIRDWMAEYNVTGQIQIKSGRFGVKNYVKFKTDPEAYVMLKMSHG